MAAPSDENNLHVPKLVLYCGVCTLPLEYCEYSAAPSKCKGWLQEFHPAIYKQMYAAEAVAEQLAASNLQDEATGTEDDSEEQKKRQNRGGKAMPKDLTKQREKEELKKKKARVTIKMVERNKRKSVTHIRGMEVFGLDLKQVAKRCANKFACGCSVVRNPAGYDEVVIQGDVVDDLVEFIPEEWPDISDAQVDVVEK